MMRTRGRERGASSLVTIAATALLTLAIAAGAAWKLGWITPPGGGGAAGGPAAPGGRKLLFYRNPMNPAITSPVAAKDEMGMDYIPVYADESGAPEKPKSIAEETEDFFSDTATPPKVEGLAGVVLDGRGVALAGVQTEAATRGNVRRTVRTVGRLVPDETGVRHVHTKIGGYVEKLHANFSGQYVTKGSPLLDLYAPEILATQEELLGARRSAERLARCGRPGAARERDRHRRRGTAAARALRRAGRSRGRHRARRCRPADGHAHRAGERLRDEQGHRRGAAGGARHGTLHADGPRARLGRGRPLRIRGPRRPRRAGGDPVAARTIPICGSREKSPTSCRCWTRRAGPSRCGSSSRTRTSRSSRGCSPTSPSRSRRPKASPIPDSAIIDSGTRQVVFVGLGQGRFEPRARPTRRARRGPGPGALRGSCRRTGRGPRELPARFRVAAALPRGAGDGRRRKTMSRRPCTWTL